MISALRARFPEIPDPVLWKTEGQWSVEMRVC